MNYKGFRKKWSLPNQGTILVTTWSIGENHKKSLTRMANVLAKVQAKNFLITNSISTT
jgi:hypothetical protein